MYTVKENAETLVMASKESGLDCCEIRMLVEVAV